MEELKLQKGLFENQEGSDNNVGVTDEIGLTMLKDQIEAQEREMKAIDTALVELDKDVKNYDEQWQIDKELMQIQYDNFGLDEDKYAHKVHFIPKFWELEKKKYWYTIRQETAKADSYLKTREKEKTNLLERKEITQNMIKELEAKLEQAEKED